MWFKKEQQQITNNKTKQTTIHKSKLNNRLHLSICTWHPFAGAMLIFSALFQV